MKIIFSLALLLVFLACTTENTDLTVDKPENPTQVKVEIDTIPPPLDSLMFNKLALDCFYHLGYATDGEFYYKSAISSVYKTIIEVIEDHGEDGADIVFLIDKTGSMQEDIINVRTNLNLIIDQLQQFKNIRLGVAAYGDKNTDGPEWYSSSPINADFSDSRKFINQLTVSEGGDYPESVYDGIARLIKNTSFRKEAKKMILVIGDAPSLEAPLSSYNRTNILDLCNKNGIKVNLFPVLVTAYKAESFVNDSRYYDNIITKVYPNPVSEKVTVQCTKTDDYTITILDLKGEVIIAERFNNDQVTVILPPETSNGTYVLRVLRNSDFQLNAKKIVVQH